MEDSRILENKRGSTVRRGAIVGALFAAVVASFPYVLTVFQIELPKQAVPAWYFSFCMWILTPGGVLADVLHVPHHARIWVWWLLNVFANAIIGLLVGAVIGYMIKALRSLKR